MRRGARLLSFGSLLLAIVGCAAPWPNAQSLDTRAFAEELYALSAYPAEQSALDMLVEAEVDLVISRWLATALTVGANDSRLTQMPRSWESMVEEMRAVVRPVAEAHMARRASALKAAWMDGKAPFVYQYERLIRLTKKRGPDIRFSDGRRMNVDGTSQLDDMEEILTFHTTPAARKWRTLWPELRAYTARLSALHYRVEADPSLPPEARTWEERAQALVRRTGGRVLRNGEWQSMMNDRLVLTMSGLDRFLLPLGTEMQAPQGDGAQMADGAQVTISERGNAIVFSEARGRGLAFRVLDSRWESDIARRLSADELRQIDDALTARWVEAKQRWFAPMEVAWDAYLAVSTRMRTGIELQAVYQSFKKESDVAMGKVWARWKKS